MHRITACFWDFPASRQPKPFAPSANAHRASLAVGPRVSYCRLACPSRGCSAHELEGGLLTLSSMRVRPWRHVFSRAVAGKWPALFAADAGEIWIDGRGATCWTLRTGSPRLLWPRALRGDQVAGRLRACQGVPGCNSHAATVHFSPAREAGVELSPRVRAC